MKAVRELLSFATVGAIGLLVDLGVLYLLAPFLGWYAGRVLSFLAAVAATWALNRRYTFAAHASGRPIALEFLQYLASMSAGALANYAVYVGVLVWLGSGRWVPAAGAALGSLAGMAINFVLARHLVFRKSREP